MLTQKRGKNETVKSRTVLTEYALETELEDASLVSTLPTARHRRRRQRDVDVHHGVDVC